MFAQLTTIYKLLKSKNVKLYDAVFALHADCTVVLLLACSILVSAKQYFGNPIQCYVQDHNRQSFVENTCWSIGTFTINNSALNIRNGADTIYNGVVEEQRGSTRMYYRYYQWVVLIFLIQAFAFRIPSLLWKVWEGGKLQELCNDVGEPILSDEKSVRKRRHLLKYFTSDFIDLNFWYTCRYIFCEILNFVLCVVNFFVMDVIFHNFWENYSLALRAIPKNNWAEWNELSSIIFPKITKCEILKYGPSGSQEKRDFLCLLPLNILNEKIFAFLWIWFIFLIITSAINVIYRMTFIFSKSFRYYIIRVYVPNMTVREVKCAIGYFRYSDWFMLTRVACNINAMMFRDFMEDLYQICKTKKLENLVGDTI